MIEAGGIFKCLNSLDPGFRRGDEIWQFSTSKEVKSNFATYSDLAIV